MPTIHCTLIHSPHESRLSEAPRHDTELLPWADPYIASLVAKLANSNGRLLEPLAVVTDSVPDDLYFGEDWGCDPDEMM